MGRQLRRSLRRGGTFDPSAQGRGRLWRFGSHERDRGHLLPYYDHLDERFTYHFSYPLPEGNYSGPASYWSEHNMSFGGESRRLWTYNQYVDGADRVRENTLAASQGLFLFAYALHQFAVVPHDLRPAALQEFIEKYASVVAVDYYQRWVLVSPHPDDPPNFNRYGIWGRRGQECSNGNFITKIILDSE